MTTPRRSFSTPSSPRPASAHACRAATTATCSQRSIRRASGRGRTSAGSTTRRAAMRTGRSYFSNHSSSNPDTPPRPARSAPQVDVTSPPSGVVAPNPVMTMSVLSAPPDHELLVT